MGGRDSRRVGWRVRSATLLVVAAVVVGVLVDQPWAAAASIGVAVLMALVVLRQHAAVLADRDLLDRLHGLTTEVAEARTVEQAMRRLLVHAAGVLRAGRAELVFFTPPNKAVQGASLGPSGVDVHDEEPEETRQLVEGWVRADPAARALGPADAHPLRRWLRNREIDDCLVVPLLHPEPHGLLVLGNRDADDAPFDEEDLRLARVFAVTALDTLLRVRRDELIDQVCGGRSRTLAPGLLHDVTGLPTEQLLEDRLAELEQAGAAAAVAAVTLDDLPTIGAEQGSIAADAVVREVGRRLLDVVRRSDLVAHLQGDRFVVVMADLNDPRVALAACERLVDQITRPVVQDRRLLRAGCSVGLAVWYDGMSSEAVLEAARDAAATAAGDPVHAVRLHVPGADQRGASVA